MRRSNKRRENDVEYEERKIKYLTQLELDEKNDSYISQEVFQFHLLVTGSEVGRNGLS